MTSSRTCSDSLFYVQTLLANHATVNDADDGGLTALIIAASKGHLQIVEVRLWV